MTSSIEHPRVEFLKLPLRTYFCLVKQKTSHTVSRDMTAARLIKENVLLSYNFQIPELCLCIGSDQTRQTLLDLDLTLLQEGFVTEDIVHCFSFSSSR